MAVLRASPAVAPSIDRPKLAPPRSMLVGPLLAPIVYDLFVANAVHSQTAGAITLTVPYTLTQEGFRFRNDDGSETTATWAAAQDTNTTLPLATNVRLRVLVDAAADPPTAPYTLYYKKTTDSTWAPVPVGAGGGSALTVTYSDSGGGNYISSGNATALTMPSWSVTAGELLVVAVGGCGSGSTGLTSQWTLSGGGLAWTEHVDVCQTSSFCATVAFYSAIATTTTSITNLAALGSSVLQVMYARWRVTGMHATPIGATAALADFSTDGQKDITLSATPASSSVVLAVAFENMDDNNATKKIDHGTSDGWTEDFDFGPSMTGANMWGAWQAQRKTSPSLTRVRWDDIKPATTTATTYTFAGAAIEIKSAAAAASPVYVATSPNITAGGEATTAQLTPPSGKTTADFSVGRMWDDENGTDSVDI
jgi:hypothetical protein